MRHLLADSEIRESHRENDDRVQDAYSLRCSPQVFGATLDAIRFVGGSVARIELQRLYRQSAGGSGVGRGGVGRELSRPTGGTGARLSWRFALTTLQAIAERRVERLVNPDLSQGLPAFLSEQPGTVRPAT